MHPKYAQAYELSREVIGAGVEVHRILGPGLLESIYEKCLRRELELRGMSVLQQQQVEVNYKGFIFTEELRFDLLVEGCLLVEVKAVQEVHSINKAQLLSYMKLLDIPLGLLMNFHEERLVDGRFSHDIARCGQPRFTNIRKHELLNRRSQRAQRGRRKR